MEPITLSTGQTVELPVTADASVLGATFAAPRGVVDRLLPDGLRPVRATPGGDGAVTLLSVEYRAVDVDGIDPYDEFGVVLSAVPRTAPGGSPPSTLHRATGGYVHYLPVSTDPARAFGTDVWGYPKVVADVDHDDDGDRRRTTVDVDGERLLSVAIDRPPSVRGQFAGYGYAVHDGDLRRAPVGVDARAGGWPLTGAVSVRLGDHPRVDPFRAVEFGGRALARFVVDGELRFHAGAPLPRV